MRIIKFTAGKLIWDQLGVRTQFDFYETDTKAHLLFAEFLIPLKSLIL